MMSHFDELAGLPGQENGTGPQPSDPEAIRYLSAVVLPLLEEARTALEKTGVTSTIEKNWSDPAVVGEPAISFYCGERGVAGTGLPIGDVVTFSVAGGKLEVTDTTTGRRVVEASADEERAIEDAVHQAVQTYYRELENSVR